MILREHYISQIRPFYDSDLIKIITGIRRSGKSVILSQIKEELEQAGRQVLSLNFENTRLLREIPDADSLISYVQARRKEGKCYVFLDEVQLVKDWNLACRTLRLEDISLFVTGSNSKLLSKEFTKELSGRYVAFCIRPFVYKEIAAYAKELGEEAPISEYLIYGGFPKRLEFREKEAMLRYLEDLHRTIVLNDIMNRYQIRKAEVFRRLVEYIMVSNGRIFSANSISKYLRSQKVQISVNTVMKYLGYLEEAYAIRQVSQYSLKAKKKLDFFEKLYDEDVAFNTIHQPFGRYDVTHNLERMWCITSLSIWVMKCMYIITGDRKSTSSQPKGRGSISSRWHTRWRKRKRMTERWGRLRDLIMREKKSSSQMMILIIRPVPCVM